MAIIIKKDTGIVRCAASSEKAEGDLYIGDALHYNLAMFFAEEDEDEQLVIEKGARIEEVKASDASQAQARPR